MARVNPEIALAEAKVDALSSKYPQIAAVGKKAVEALQGGGFGQSMNPATAKQLLAGIDELLAGLGIKVEPPAAPKLTEIKGTDTAALMQALAKSADVKVTAFGGAGAKALSEALKALVEKGEYANAAKIATHLLDAEVDEVKGEQPMYSSLVDTVAGVVRMALEEADQSPEDLGMPEAGPVAF